VPHLTTGKRRHEEGNGAALSAARRTLAGSSCLARRGSSWAHADVGAAATAGVRREAARWRDGRERSKREADRDQSAQVRLREHFSSPPFARRSLLPGGSRSVVTRALRLRNPFDTLDGSALRRLSARWRPSEPQSRARTSVAWLPDTSSACASRSRRVSGALEAVANLPLEESREEVKP